MNEWEASTMANTRYHQSHGPLLFQIARQFGFDTRLGFSQTELELLGLVNQYILTTEVVFGTSTRLVDSPNTSKAART